MSSILSKLPFKITRTPYPASSKMTGQVVQKVRSDGRVGPAVGDEATLWDLLVEADSILATLRDRLAQECSLRADLEEARDGLQAQLDEVRQAGIEREHELETLRARVEELVEDLAEVRGELASAQVAAEQKGRSRR